MFPCLIFDFLLVTASLLAGAVAAISGFGIGSLLTPLLSLEVGTKMAVAIVSIPHFSGTLLRFWFLRKDIDRNVFLRFGIWSAAGGLNGALLHNSFRSDWLALVLGGLLIFAGFSGVAGLSDRVRFSPSWAWVAGSMSGLFGGLVGNQGGIRSAALLGFNVPKAAFVSTATAIGLIVDAARMPVYFALSASEILDKWAFVLMATIGVILGTISGKTLLGRIPERVFRKIVFIFVLLLGMSMIFGTAIRYFPRK